MAEQFQAPTQPRGRGTVSVPKARHRVDRLSL